MSEKNELIPNINNQHSTDILVKIIKELLNVTIEITEYQNNYQTTTKKEETEDNKENILSTTEEYVKE
jgi:hypothetical protein